MRREPLPRLFNRDVSYIHCVGVGGMGLGPLAIYLSQMGFQVSGEDDALAETNRLLLAGQGVAIGPVPIACDLVVYSSAIARSHPAFVAANARSLPLVRRGELLAEVVQGKKLVAVCGSHGKTTTAAMLVTALRAANFPAGYVIGGLFNDDVAPARVGSNDWIVAEIDESDGTIEGFSPEIMVAVNLDWDHPDFYRQSADFEAAFAALMRRTRGVVLVSDTCATSQRLSAKVAANVGTPVFRSFGKSGDFAATVTGENAEHLALELGGFFPPGTASVRALGEFNASNAAAAFAAVHLMGAPWSAGLLAGYAGVRRRQAVLFSSDAVTVVEDYAHHPAEIRALLGSLRSRLDAERGELVAVFQPHRYTRTAQFRAEFAAALALADRVHLLDVYAAGEKPVAGGTTADIYAELKRANPLLAVSYLPVSGPEFLRTLSRGRRRGDWVVFIGAGDIDQVARAWVDELTCEAAAARRWDEHADALKTLISASTKLKREEPMATKTTLRVGGAARIYAEPASLPDLQALWREAQHRSIEIFLLGRGSNLLVPDEGVPGLVISLAHASWAAFEPRPDGRVWVGAGLRLKNLCGLASKAGLAGFEFLEGIPGSVGGALRMNAGAMGGWMFDVVDEVQLITEAGEIKTLRKAEMHVEYRHCAELHHAIALGALLRPTARGEADAVTRQVDTYRRKRQESQPREPSAGCIFKNPPGNSAGRLIDESGLKGERVGDAEVSTVHANFIVNRGHATAEDVLALVRQVRARVKQAKAVDLEPEVLLYGKSWKDVL